MMGVSAKDLPDVWMVLMRHDDWKDLWEDLTKVP